MDNSPVVQRLAKMFTRMAYFGGAFLVAGVVLGILLSGPTRATVIGAACAGGGLLLVAGLRGRRRARRVLTQLQEKQRRSHR